MRAALASGIAVLALAASPALAELEPGALEGEWCFQAEPFFASGYTQEISGELVLTATGEGEYSCTLSIFDYVREEDLRIRAEQSCAAVYDAGRLTVRSRVLSVEPAWVSYVPDHFTLEVESARAMSGVMHSPGDTPAAFARCQAPVS